MEYFQAFLLAVGMMCAAVFLHILLEIWEEKYQRKRAEQHKREHEQRMKNEQ